MSLRTMSMQDLNPHILCVLCGGYLVDATTIIECLHSFCRSCIVKYLETSYHCPVCDVEVHKTKPLLHIRRDRTLQDIVYKIVPGIYCEELTRRKGFEAKLAEERPPEKEESVNDKDSDEKEIDSTPFEDSVCITLEYFRKTRNRLEKEVFPTRYLRCSSAVTVRVLTKFLVMKFAIPDTHKTEIIRCDEILDGHLTMKEVSRMYGLYVKPFVDLQYVFLEKNDTSLPSEKPRSLEPRRKRIKKRKGNKNLLKRCLVPSAPRPRKNTALENSSVPAPPLSCENSVETSQPRPCENERKEDLVLSPLHPCENVKKEDLIPSLPVASDKSQISKKLWNGDVGSRLPDEFQSVEKVGVIYPNTNAAEETTNENFISLVNSGAVENLNHETSGVPEPKTGSNNVFDDLLLSAPVGSTKDHDQQSSEPSDGSAVLSTNGSGNFTNELFINKTLSHLENLFA